MTELEVDVRPSGFESAIVYAPFDRALEELKSGRYDLISLAIQAQLRIQQGAQSSISQGGNYVLNDVIYTPKGKAFLTLNSSPIALNATEATQAHREGREFYLDNIEQFLEDSVEFPDEDIQISTNRFGDEDLTVKAFGGEKQAKAYGEFLSQAKIKEMPVWVIDRDYVNEQEKPFARKLLFGRSILVVGDNHGLYDNNGVRGVRLVVSTEDFNS